MCEAITAIRIIANGCIRFCHFVKRCVHDLKGGCSITCHILREVITEDTRRARVVVCDDAAHQSPGHDLSQSSIFEHMQMMSNCTGRYPQPCCQLLGSGGLVLDNAQD